LFTLSFSWEFKNKKLFQTGYIKTGFENQGSSCFLFYDNILHILLCYSVIFIFFPNITSSCTLFGFQKKEKRKKKKEKRKNE
jgi:hypothetical protein